MRVALGMAVSALCFASAPAFAGEGAAIRGDAPLLLHDAAATPVAGAALPLDFRLRTAVVATTPSLLDDPDGKVRRRIASSMFDYYPGGEGVGFHLSAGMRYFSRTNFLLEAQKVTHGLLYAPNWRTNSGMRAGFRKFTPAVTMGYTAAIAKNLLVGIEGGTLLGSANIAAPMALRHPAIGRGVDYRSGVNPIANLVMGIRF